MNIGTDREVIHGSAPTASAPDAPALFTPLTFDASKFMEFVAHEELSEEEAVLLLRAYWDTFVGFADIAFGISSTHQAVDRFEGSRADSPCESDAMISFSSSHLTNANDDVVPLEERGATGEKDS
jgi:hypothetical protein